MHKSTACFQNSHKFWNLAVRFQKQGSLHAESIKGSDIWWDGSHYISQGFWAVPIYTAKSVLARGKRGAGGPWHSFMDCWGLLLSLELEGSQRCAVVLPLSPGVPTRAGSQPAAAAIPGVTQSPLWHSRSVAELVPPCHFNTSPNSWCLQSSGQRHASNKHGGHSLVGTLNAVSSLSPLLCLPAE